VGRTAPPIRSVQQTCKGRRIGSHSRWGRKFSQSLIETQKTRRSQRS
jgi:hypothetical protein